MQLWGGWGMHPPGWTSFDQLQKLGANHLGSKSTHEAVHEVRPLSSLPGVGPWSLGLSMARLRSHLVSAFTPSPCVLLLEAVSTLFSHIKGKRQMKMQINTSTACSSYYQVEKCLEHWEYRILSRRWEYSFSLSGRFVKTENIFPFKFFSESSFCFWDYNYITSPFLLLPPNAPMYLSLPAVILRVNCLFLKRKSKTIHHNSD